MNILGGFLRDISYNKAKPYLKELNKTRADLHVILHMDDYDFEFFDSIPVK